MLGGAGRGERGVKKTKHKENRRHSASFKQFTVVLYMQEMQTCEAIKSLCVCVLS